MRRQTPVNRRTATKVRSGMVQRKNRVIESPSVYNSGDSGLIIERRRPGAGYRHLLRKSEIERFISIVPDWDELSNGLRAIVLDEGDDRCMGWHRPGIVAVCAWERDLWMTVSGEFLRDHRETLMRLGVAHEKQNNENLCNFTVGQARAFQLMHILLHEIGHHHDRMSTRTRKRASRGEGYSEAFAFEQERVIWDQYERQFGFD